VRECSTNSEGENYALAELVASAGEGGEE